MTILIRNGKFCIITFFVPCITGARSSNNKTLNVRLLATQVCHRSYIIAAKVAVYSYGKININIIRLYLPSLLVEACVINIYQGKKHEISIFNTNKYTN
jgi:hypothetical protein